MLYAFFFLSKNLEQNVNFSKTVASKSYKFHILTHIGKIEIVRKYTFYGDTNNKFCIVKCFKGIAPKIIPPYPDEYLQIAKTKVPEKYKNLKDYKTIMDSYKPDILIDYDKTMRWYLMKYVLNDPSEWHRLKIQTFPAEYPVMVIRAPVPWHTTYVLAQQSMENKYFRCHIVVIKIRDLWTERLVLFF